MYRVSEQTEQEASPKSSYINDPTPVTEILKTPIDNEGDYFESDAEGDVDGESGGDMGQEIIERFEQMEKLIEELRGKNTELEAKVIENQNKLEGKDNY